MSGITSNPILTMLETTKQLTPEQRLQQQQQSLSASLNQLNLALQESERATESLRKLKNEKVQEIERVVNQLDELYTTKDDELAKLLALKLPSVTRGIECYINSQTQQVSIYLLFCFHDQGDEINTFFCAFLNDPDFVVKFNYGGIGRTVAFNQPVITVQVPLADREKLVEGLKLATAAPQITSTTLTARC